MAKVNHTEDIGTRLKAVEARLAAVERGRPLASTSISQGNLDVRTPDGEQIMRAGVLPYGSEDAFGVEIRRLNGGLQARFFDTPDGNGYAAIFDSEGNIIFSEDTASNRGIATPYLAYRSTPYSEVVTPPQATTSASFEKVHRITAQKAQPWVRTVLLIKTDADTVGQVILTQSGSQIGSTLDVPVASYGYFFLDAPVAGNHMDLIQVDVEARRIAGTGSVRVGMAVVSGRQS